MARGAAARGRTRTTRATRRAFDRDARARAIDGVKLVDGARARAANGGDGGRRDGRESAPMAVAAASLSIKPFARAGTGRGRRKTDGEPRTRAIVTCADKK